MKIHKGMLLLTLLVEGGVHVSFVAVFSGKSFLGSFIVALFVVATSLISVFALWQKPAKKNPYGETFAFVGTQGPGTSTTFVECAVVNAKNLLRC